MLRLVNFVCVAFSGLMCLWLYHVAEQTRMAGAELHRVNHEIADEQNRMAVLQAEWARVADPARIQKLAAADLGLNDTPAVELSSLKQLPRRGAGQGPGNAQLHDANASVSVGGNPADVHLANDAIRN